MLQSDPRVLFPAVIRGDDRAEADAVCVAGEGGSELKPVDS